MKKNQRDILYNINRFLMRMNKARPTMLGSLIKHRAYLKYIKYNKNVNNNNNNKNNNNNNSNISSSSSSSSSSTNNNKEEDEEINENFEMED